VLLLVIIGVEREVKEVCVTVWRRGDDVHAVTAVMLIDDANRREMIAILLLLLVLVLVLVLILV